VITFLVVNSICDHKVSHSDIAICIGGCEILFNG